MQHFVKFKYVIFAYLAHYFWLSCHVRTIFDRSEILKEKPQQSEQREANKQTNKQKNVSNYLLEINFIWDLLYFHIITIITFSWKRVSMKEFHFVNSVDIQLVTDDWVMNMIGE